MFFFSSYDVNANFLVLVIQIRYQYKIFSNRLYNRRRVDSFFISSCTNQAGKLYTLNTVKKSNGNLILSKKQRSIKYDGFQLLLRTEGGLFWMFYMILLYTSRCSLMFDYSIKYQQLKGLLNTYIV